MINEMWHSRNKGANLYLEQFLFSLKSKRSHLMKKTLQKSFVSNLRKSTIDFIFDYSTKAKK